MNCQANTSRVRSCGVQASNKTATAGWVTATAAPTAADASHTDEALEAQPSASIATASAIRDRAATSTGLRPSARRPAIGAASREPTANAVNVIAPARPPRPREVAMSVYR